MIISAYSGVGRPIRLHLCWGNYEGPHHLDIPLQDIIDIVLGANANSISFEGANPHHEHEWAIWKEVKLPDEKFLIPGVIDSTTNFIEHPEPCVPTFKPAHGRRVRQGDRDFQIGGLP